MEPILLAIIGALTGMVGTAAVFIGGWFGNKFKALEEKVAASPNKIDDALLRAVKELHRESRAHANDVISAKLEDPKAPLGAGPAT